MENQNDVILIKNAFKSSFKAGSNINFLLDGVRNPPSMRGVDTIVLKTLDGVGSVISEKDDCVLVATEQAELPGNNIQVELKNDQVSAYTNMKLLIRLEKPVPKDGLLRVTFPPEVKLTNIQQSDKYLKTVLLMGSTRRNLDF